MDALAVDGRGAAGDRAHAIFDMHKGAPRRLTARQAPRLLAWKARYDADLSDPSLAAPDGAAWRGRTPACPRAVRRPGARVTQHSDPALQQDLPDSLLVTVQATLEAVSSELGAELDLRRFRTNIHVELDAEAFAEEGWEGRTLRVGAAELELLHPCERCAIPTRDPDTQEKWAPLLRHLFDRHTGRFGINARARGESTIAIGDEVTLD